MCDQHPEGNPGHRVEKNGNGVEAKRRDDGIGAQADAALIFGQPSTQIGQEQGKQDDECIAAPVH